jgi:hypothetical protein
MLIVQPDNHTQFSTPMNAANCDSLMIVKGKETAQMRQTNANQT